MFDNVKDGEFIGGIKFDITKNSENPYPIDIHMETELGWNTFIITVMNGLTSATDHIVREVLLTSTKDDDVPSEWIDSAVPIVSQYLMDELHDAADQLAGRMQWFHQNTDGLSFAALDDFIKAIVAFRDNAESDAPDAEEPEDG